jgi:hypothetical protein
MAGRDHQHDPVTGQAAVLQVGPIVLPPDQAEAGLASLHLPDDRRAVADRGADPDVRVLAAEARQQGREQVLAGDGTGGQVQFSRGRGLVAGDLPSGLPVEFEYALGVVVERPARLGRQDPAAQPPEQGDAERPFEGLDTLADSRLR